MSADYGELRARAAMAARELEDSRADVDAEWQDATAEGTRPHLDAASAALSRLGSALDEQAEAHEQADRLGELIQRQSEEAGQVIDQAQQAAADADRALAEAETHTAEAAAAASASGESLRRALVLASQAGRACGEAVGSGELEGLIQHRVVAGRERQVWAMVVKAVGVEVVKDVAGDLAGKLLQIPDGALPPGFKSQIADAVVESAPVAEARIRSAIRDLAADHGRG